MNFETFLSGISIQPLHVIDKKIHYRDYTLLDLSTKNKELEQFDIADSTAFEEYISSYLKSKTAKVAFGGYLEQRNMYKRSRHFNQESVEEERNIHLGIDLWCKANTKVVAVLDGEIHSFKNNLNFGDYGPTIIVKHIVGHRAFFSLYGHLSLASIKNLRIGQKVFQGQTIACIGDANINGDYAPHLHFQLIKDLQNYEGDYPGVTNLKQLNMYKENCPNPNLLLKLNF